MMPEYTSAKRFHEMSGRPSAPQILAISLSDLKERK
jgi:hypothetical protein